MVLREDEATVPVIVFPPCANTGTAAKSSPAKNAVRIIVKSFLMEAVSPWVHDMCQLAAKSIPPERMSLVFSDAAAPAALLSTATSALAECRTVHKSQFPDRGVLKVHNAMAACAVPDGPREWI